MTKPEFAKMLLNGDVEPEFISVYELSNNGKIDSPEIETAIIRELQKKYQYPVIIKPGELMTMDFNMQRVRINIDEDGEIWEISVG